MEAYSTTSYPSASNNSSCITQNPKGFKSESQSLLHSVRKSQTKQGKRAPVAPPSTAPIRVFKVDPINFRDVVQQLTGAPEFKPHHHLHQLGDINVAGTTSSTNSSLVFL